MTYGSLSAKEICNHIRGLSARQKTICHTRPDAMVAIGKGARKAVEECQWQFRTSRWNCSLRSNTSSLELGNSLQLGELSLHMRLAWQNSYLST